MAGTFSGQFVPPFDPQSGPIGAATLTPGYDPKALAEYIEKRRKMGKTPLFTDDAKLAMDEGGFFIDTGTARAAQSKSIPGLVVSEGEPKETFKTGNPLIDNVNAASAAIVNARFTLDQEKRAAVEKLPAKQALDKLTKTITLRQSFGLLQDPAEMQQLQHQLVLADTLYKQSLSNLDTDPVFAERTAALNRAETLLKPAIEQANIDQRIAASAEQTIAIDQAKSGLPPVLSPAIVERVAAAAGVPVDQVISGRTSGLVTPEAVEIGIADFRGERLPPKLYFDQGQSEQGKASSNIAIAKASPALQPALKVAADGLAFNHKKSILEAQQAFTNLTADIDSSDIRDKYPGEFIALKQAEQSGKVETVTEVKKQLFSKLVQERYALHTVELKKNLTTENLELLKPGSDWPTVEAEIGTKLVALIENSPAASLDDKLAGAIEVMLDAQTSARALSSTVTRLKQEYVRRFNSRYQTLGMTANGTELMGLDIALGAYVFGRVPKTTMPIIQPIAEGSGMIDRSGVAR